MASAKVEKAPNHFGAISFDESNLLVGDRSVGYVRGNKVFG